MIHISSGREVVLRQTGRLRPGLFINTGGEVWHHWLQRLPEHVRRSKGGGQLPRIARLSRLLLPRLLWADGGTAVDGYPIAIGNKRGDCVLLNPQAGKLARVFGSTPLSAEQIELRHRWAHHIRSPHFEVGENGYLLMEDYLPGLHVSELSTENQIAMVRRISLAYARMAQAESGGSCLKDIALIQRLCTNERLPRQLCHYLTQPGVLDASCSWPTVHYGSDNSPGNVMFVIQGHRLDPVFLDVFPMKQRPFFSHAVGITIGWCVPELRNAYLTGVFDAEFETLFSSAGTVFHPTLAFRQTILAIAVALNFGSPSSDADIRALHWLTHALGLNYRGGWVPA